MILIHGISTRARWMGEIKPTLEDAGFTVAPTSYGKYGLHRFLSPFIRSRKKAIERVAEDIKTARRAYKLATGVEPAKMSVISHSFGTYVASRIILDYPEYDWERVIFCGSVVRDDFPFNRVLDKFRHPLLNHIGTRDFWPALAESAGWGYGSVGSTGFNRPPVESRWHRGFRHSDFLTEDFCKTFWIPFLRGEKPKKADKSVDMPKAIRAITWLPLRWLLLLLILSPPLAAVSLTVSKFWGSLVLLTSRPEVSVETLCGKYPAFCSSAKDTLQECYHGLGKCGAEEKAITIVCRGGKCSIVN